MSKLLIVELIALSVAKLEAELAANSYTAAELQEALDAEAAGENRSTALKEIKAALADALAPDEEPEETTAGLFVCAGKSITTKAGIKVAGDEIAEGMLPEESVELLIEKKYLEIRD